MVLKIRNIRSSEKKPDNYLLNLTCLHRAVLHESDPSQLLRKVHQVGQHVLLQGMFAIIDNTFHDSFEMS